MLSDRDFSRLLGKGIDIYPLDERRNIESADIYMTASPLAFSTRTKGYLYNKNEKTITIDADDTALIVSNEIVKLDMKHAATCHARVSLVASGLGYFGTPIKPGYEGNLIIALQNNTSSPHIIRLNEKITTVMFHELTSEAAHGNKKKLVSIKERLSTMGISIGHGSGIEMTYREVVEKSIDDKTKEIYASLHGKKFMTKKNIPAFIDAGLFLIFIIQLVFLFYIQRADIHEALMITVPITGTCAFGCLTVILGK